ncbi:MAG: SpoIID/LytB domain-containing protein [Clostridiales bacterium]|jgi:peptidoglycan hydrolase-like amidase|nr:SpoIID/LytB domain-containing protein [Clostridiales bacterium]
MRKKWLGFAAVLILLAAVILSLYRMLYITPPEKSVKLFLDNLITSTDDRLYSYLDKHVDQEHPFIKLALNQKPFTGFKINETKAVAKDTYRSWITLYLKQSSITVPITLEKTAKGWLIEALPTVVHIPAAIPLIRSEDGIAQDQLLLDVAGDHILCSRTLPSDMIHHLVPSDIILVENQLVDIQPLKAMKLSKVMAASRRESYIEDRLLGKIPVDNQLPVYKMQDGTPAFRGSMAVLVGSTDSTLYCGNDGKGRALIAQDPIVPKDGIRVLIRNRDNSAIIHDQLIFTCDTGFTAETHVSNASFSFSAKDILTIKASEGGMILYHNGRQLESSPDRWYIRPSGQGMLRVANKQDGTGNTPSSAPYRGTMEVSYDGNGLILINEVNLEEYLYSVVPSEMPIKFGLEALKAQAVAARSYAVRCFASEGYAAYGAHVDDSTASQVYNSISEQSISVQAVNETYGLAAFFEGQVIDARFFSTSCGYTANFHEVWSDKNHNFPPKEIPYLVSKPQFPSNIPDLHNEENFRAFIAQWELDGYDRFSPYFRWWVTLKREELEAIIRNNLHRIQQADPYFVLTKKDDGTFVQESIPEETGQLLNIQVARRGQGGNIMELDITTTHGTFKVIKEYNVRQELRPVNYLDGGKPIILHCFDGSARENFPILPSAFAYIDLDRDSEGTITDITISGGGYGHGVGMSQYGAYGLSLMGYSYEQIIMHYYPGTELRNIYDYKREGSS